VVVLIKLTVAKFEITPEEYREGISPVIRRMVLDKSVIGLIEMSKLYDGSACGSPGHEDCDLQLKLDEPRCTLLILLPEKKSLRFDIL